MWSWSVSPPVTDLSSDAERSSRSCATRWSTPPTGTVGVVLVRGEAGIGKSRLARGGGQGGVGDARRPDRSRGRGRRRLPTRRRRPRRGAAGRARGRRRRHSVPTGRRSRGCSRTGPRSPAPRRESGRRPRAWCSARPSRAFSASSGAAGPASCCSRTCTGRTPTPGPCSPTSPSPYRPCPCSWSPPCARTSRTAPAADAAHAPARRHDAAAGAPLTGRRAPAGRLPGRHGPVDHDHARRACRRAAVPGRGAGCLRGPGDVPPTLRALVADRLRRARPATSVGCSPGAAVLGLTPDWSLLHQVTEVSETEVLGGAAGGGGGSAADWSMPAPCAGATR